MMVTPPPIIFIPPPAQTPSCPKCGNAEDTKKVCSHCGYEYPKSGVGTAQFLCVFFSIVVLLLVSGWAVWTTAEWFMSGKSLEKVIENQIEWAKDLAITEAQKRTRIFAEYDRIEKDRLAFEAVSGMQYEPPGPNWDPHRKVVCYTIASGSWVDFSKDRGGDPLSGCHEMFRDGPDGEWRALRKIR